AVKNSVMGIGTDRRMHAGNVWLTGTVTSAGATRTLHGVNVLHIPYGLTVYTPRWGTTPIRLPSDAVTRNVAAGLLSTGTGRWTTVPSTGSMVVARGSTAVAWLKSLRRGSSFTVRLSQHSDAVKPFRLAFDVGQTIVASRGVVRYGLSCRRVYPQPARTAIGYRNYGKTLMIVVVTDHPGTRVHGLDATQMSKLMVELGAWKASLFDGSGSSEMIARMPATGRLAIRN